MVTQHMNRTVSIFLIIPDRPIFQLNFSFEHCVLLYRVQLIELSVEIGYDYLENFDSLIYIRRLYV